MTDAKPAEDSPELFDPPTIPEEALTGRHAVYDRTLGRYLGVFDAKPSASEVKALADEGNTTVVVAV